MIYTTDARGLLTGAWSDYASAAARRYAKKWGDTLHTAPGGFPAVFREGVIRQGEQFRLQGAEWVDPTSLTPFQWGDIALIVREPKTFRIQYKGQWTPGGYHHIHVGDVFEPYDQWEMAKAVYWIGKEFNGDVGLWARAGEV